MQASDEATLMDEVEDSCQQCYASSSGQIVITGHIEICPGGDSAMDHLTRWKYIIFIMMEDHANKGH